MPRKSYGAVNPGVLHCAIREFACTRRCRNSGAGTPVGVRAESSRSSGLARRTAIANTLTPNILVTGWRHRGVMSTWLKRGAGDGGGARHSYWPAAGEQGEADFRESTAAQRRRRALVVDDLAGSNVDAVMRIPATRRHDVRAERRLPVFPGGRFLVARSLAAVQRCKRPRAPLLAGSIAASCPSRFAQSSITYPFGSRK